MVTDPPYGVEYDPGLAQRRPGVKHNKQRLGKVANDDRADWREAWALFPGLGRLCLACRPLCQHGAGLA